MSTFIIWDKSDDAAFRARYFEITGEAVQDLPAESHDGTQYMTGSSRIAPAQISILEQEFAIGTDPQDFARKTDDDE